MTALGRTSRAFAFLLALALLAAAPAAHAGPTCSGTNLLDQTLANGARWQLCWEEQTNPGIVLSEIYFSSSQIPERLVLAEVSLAQIHVPYDDNGARFHDITDYGAGGTRMSDLAAADCPGGTLLKSSGKNRLCKTVRARSAVYDAVPGQQQGTLLEIFSVSHIGMYNYIPTYRFGDDGGIEIMMGATGQLQRFAYGNAGKVKYGWPLATGIDRIGLSHIHNYFFRLDFDVGGTKNDDVFERIDVTPDGSANTRTKSIIAFANEGSDDIAPDVLRSWRVRDATLADEAGHALSYEIAPLESGHRDHGPSYEPFTAHDIYVTRYKSNELYASHNDLVIANAPNDLTQFYAPPESIAGGSDLVVWYRMTFHHIPRDEDETKMHAHWSGFRIEPRDVSSLPEPGSSAALAAGLALLAALRPTRSRED